MRLAARAVMRRNNDLVFVLGVATCHDELRRTFVAHTVPCAQFPVKQQQTGRRLVVRWCMQLVSAANGAELNMGSSNLPLLFGSKR